jgi:hypothetical protein
MGKLMFVAGYGWLPVVIAFKENVPTSVWPLGRVFG